MSQLIIVWGQLKGTRKMKIIASIIINYLDIIGDNSRGYCLVL